MSVVASSACSPLKFKVNPVSSVSAKGPQIIIIPNGPRCTSQKIKISPRLIASSPELVAHSPVKILGQVMNTSALKRPLSPASSTDGSCHDDAEITAAEDAGAPVRKRANLDHLSPEEKLLRRKLKNRVAAQNARDKKRAKMDDMEDLITQLQNDKKKLEEENKRLADLNKRLEQENDTLKSQSNNVISYPLSPASSADPRSPMSSDCRVQDIVVSRPLPNDEPAALFLQPKGSLGRGRGTAVDLRTLCLLWTLLVVAKQIVLSKDRKSRQSNNIMTIKKLPLKKRTTTKLRRSWNPASLIWKTS